MFILEGVNMRLMKMMKSIFAEHYNLVQMKSEFPEASFLQDFLRVFLVQIWLSPLL